jgi:transcriptional regulator with XRE-family HTH domain
MSGMDAGITFSTVAGRFGWNLRLARKRAGLSQRELARRIGRDQRRIADWERGRCRPYIDALVRLSEALDIDPGVLLRETKGLGG